MEPRELSQLLQQLAIAQVHPRQEIGVAPGAPFQGTDVGCGNVPDIGEGEPSRQIEARPAF
jgi:hypothetical protein